MVQGALKLILEPIFEADFHPIVLEKVAQRVSDEAVLWLLQLLLKASGKQAARPPPPGGARGSPRRGCGVRHERKGPRRAQCV